MPLLPPDELQKAKRRAHRATRRSTATNRRARLALLILLVPDTLFWATYEQQGNTIALVGRCQHRPASIAASVRRGAQIPTTWFQAFNPFMIFAFTPFVVALWTRQAARGAEPSTVTKMAFGCFGVTAANLVMARRRWCADGGKASWLWLFAYFVVITIGELYLSPVGLSLVTKVAPAASCR